MAGTVMTVVQLATLFFAPPAPYYAFFSAIEIGTTLAIAWYGWKWTEPAPTAAAIPSRAPITPVQNEP